MDLDLWDCFGRAKQINLDLQIQINGIVWKGPAFNQTNTVFLRLAEVRRRTGITFPMLGSWA